MSEDINKNSDGGESKGARTTQFNSSFHRNKKEEDMRIWGILIFGIIGATATTFAVGQLRRSVDWFHSQFTMAQSSSKGTSGGFSRSSFQEEAKKSSRSSFQEEARRRYARRLQEEYEEEMERVERIRRMQSVFNREKNKHRRGYERWREDSYNEYHQHFQRDDWYWKTDWKTDSTYGSWSKFKNTGHTPANYSMSHHYAILGLARSRATPYTDDEIKSAFRSKAMQYHPDQNQENKEVAEAKFKEIMTSYEAIKTERKNNAK